jgi:hypothetical protein
MLLLLLLPGTTSRVLRICLTGRLLLCRWNAFGVGTAGLCAARGGVIRW